MAKPSKGGLPRAAGPLGRLSDQSQEWIRSQAAFTTKWEEAQAAVRLIHDAYGKKLDAFCGKSLVTGSEEHQQYHNILIEYQDAVRQEFTRHGFPEEKEPEGCDTPAKLLAWLDWMEYRDCRLIPPAKIYLDGRTKAIAAGLNPPHPIGDAKHDLLTLRQWCKAQLAEEKPAGAPQAAVGALQPQAGQNGAGDDSENRDTPTFNIKTGLLTIGGNHYTPTSSERHVLRVLVQQQSATLTELQQANARPDKVLKGLLKKYSAPQEAYHAPWSCWSWWILDHHKACQDFAITSP